MDLKQFNDKISNAKDLEWFNSHLETIKFKYTDITLNFKSVSDLFEFVLNQIQGWSSISNEIPNPLTISKNTFDSLRGQLELFVEKYAIYQRDSLNPQWESQVKQQLRNLSNCFTFDSPQVVFLLAVYKEYRECFDGAYQYITDGNMSNIANRNHLKGAFLAYEFSQKGDSDITDRSKKEQISINNLKEQFQNSISGSGKQVTEHIANINSKYQEYTNEIDTYKKGKVDEVNSWFEESKSNFVAFSTRSDSRIKELEKTYEELLRLKKPADYWKTRALVLKNEGWTALRWLIGLVFLACLTLYFLLWLTPGGMLLSFIKGDASAIKWSIVYVTFISFLAFGIRALNKVAFSSFHLARDAEEREQLTYVYLALIKDKSVDEKDKNLIMQSLFSRAETGLLKDESGPTMPGSIIDNITRK